MTNELAVLTSFKSRTSILLLSRIINLENLPTSVITARSPLCLSLAKLRWFWIIYKAVLKNCNLICKTFISMVKSESCDGSWNHLDISHLANKNTIPMTFLSKSKINEKIICDVIREIKEKRKHFWKEMEEWRHFWKKMEILALTPFWT